MSTFDKYDDLIKGKMTGTARKIPQLSTDLVNLAAEIRIEALSSHQNDGLLEQAIEEADTKMIVEILRRGNPTRYSLEKLLIISIKDQYDLVQVIKQFQGQPAWMEPYFAAALWYRGNLTEASACFRRLFFENDELTVLRLLKDITDDVVGRKGEAMFITLTQLAEYFVCFFDDYRLLLVVWRASFASDWFSDRQHANQLYVKHPQLRRIIGHQTALLSKLFLISDDVSACQRLLELLLAAGDRTAIRTLLNLMFDHSYLKRNKRACAEIEKFASTLDISIGKKNFFIDLFKEPKATDTKTIKPPKFRFKF